MALVSDIEIRLRADIARLQQDMDRARQQVGGAMSKITQLAKGAAGALAAIGAGMAVGVLANFVKQAIDVTDAVSDISQRTGVAIKDIAGLQLWFQIGGAEAGEFEGAMIKLANKIATGADEFKRIGVATRNADGSLRSSVEVLSDSADAFQKLQDNSAKTALAIEIFGKSGATLIPILNSGSEGLREMTEMADKLGLTFDQNTVDAAGAFNDTLDFLGLAAQGVGRQLAAQLLPALNSVAGSFLDFVVKGDGVKKMAEGISAVLKTLYTVGVSVYTVFKTLGNTLAAAAAQVVAVMTGDFKAAASIGQIWKEEVAADFTSAAKTITDVWNNAGGETVAALAGIQKKSATVADKASKDAEKQAEAYKSLMRTLEDRVASTARELAGLLPLNEAEKAHLDLTRQIADGKLRLTKVQKMRAESLIDEARANEVLAKSNKEFEDLQQQLIKNSAELAAERYSLIESAKQEAEQNELAIEIYGMSEAAIIRLTASRLMDQEAQRLGRTLTEDEIADLQRVIDLKERSAKAVADRSELEASKTFWTDIEKTAHDTFVSIADGGKNAFQRLKDTAKNTFFDWLYQQTLKKWIVNIGTSVTGAGVAGAAQAAGGGIGSVSGIASLIGSVKGIGSGALQTAGAVLTGQAGLGSTISAGFSALASGTASGITAGLSSLAGTLGPIALGIAGAAKLLSSAFGRGPKELTGNSKLTGSLTSAGFAGSFQDEWKKKGGWFSSSKTGFDSRAVGNEVSMMLDTTYDAIKTSSADYARMLGLNADAISNRTQSISIAMGKDEAANQKAIADFFTGVANTVAGELLPEISKFQMAGEEASTTLQRLATNYAGLDQVLAIMGSTSEKAFGAVGVASIEARERLIAFAGGLESLASQTTFFNQNFLGQAEQIAIVQKPLNEALANLGYAGIATADQFKAAVLGLSESGALATAEGAKTYAGLLALAPAFKTVSDYLKEVSDAAAETAKDLEQVALAERERAEAAIQAAKEAALAQLEANEQVLRGLVDVALGVVQRSVEAQKNIVTKAYNDSMTELQARISSVGESISKITELSTLLKNSLGTVSSNAQQGASRAAARAQITTALAIAKASGVLPSADSLKDALSTINQDASDQFSSLLDYQREVARTNAEIEALGGLTDKQLTEAQMQLRLLEQTKALAEQQYADEMRRLDGILEWAQAEVDAINGVNNSVMGVWAAMNGLNVALADLKTGATPGNPGGSTLSVEQLYRDVLGREGEAAGISFWRKAFGSVVDSGEYAEFLKSAQPELDMIDRQKRQMESVATMPGSGTMSSSAESNSEEMKQMKSDMSRTAAAVEQLASQFNQVSGGGNSLLTEPA